MTAARTLTMESLGALIGWGAVGETETLRRELPSSKSATCRANPSGPVARASPTKFRGRASHPQLGATHSQLRASRPQLRAKIVEAAGACAAIRSADLPYACTIHDAGGRV